MSDILTGTPPELTYLHPLVREAWSVAWAVASGALMVILGWMGLILIMQHLLGQTQVGWRELVPRLVLGLAAAATSLWWCALVIDVADAVSGFIAVSLDVTAGDLLRASLWTLVTAVQAGSVGMALLMSALYLVYGFFVLYLLVQMVLRLALIDLLLALAPMALGLWVLPHTAGWGRQWLRLFLVTVFQQAVQLVALALAFGFLGEVRGHRVLRAGAGPGVEAAAVDGVHLPGREGAVTAGQSRDLRRVAAHPALRHVPARLHGAVGPDGRAARGRSPGRPRRGGGGCGGGGRGPDRGDGRHPLHGGDGHPLRRGRSQRSPQERNGVAHDDAGSD